MTADLEAPNQISDHKPLTKLGNRPAPHDAAVLKAHLTPNYLLTISNR